MSLLDGLITNLPLNESSGLAVDTRGDNDGTVTGATQGASALILGTASVSFDGVNDRIVLANEANFDRENTLPWSISLWMNPTDPGAGASPVFASKFGLSRNWFFSIVRINATTFKIRMDFISTDGNITITNSADTFSFGSLFHFIFTYSGNRSIAGVNIYMNNVLMNKGDNVNVAHQPGSTVLTNSAVIVGAKDEDGLDSFTGRIQ